jgi:hypothetical protein
MKKRFLAVAGVFFLSSLGFLANATVLQAQSGVAAVEKAAAALAPKGWTLPRTPDGQPDLQGYYTNISLTPMERSAAMAGKPFFSPDEVAAYEKTATAARNKDNRDEDKLRDVNNAYNDLFWDGGKKVAVTLQSSIIVDPADGHIPAYTAAAQKKIADEAEMVKEKCADPTRVCPPGQNLKPSLADKPEDFPLMARCITWPTAGPPMLPSAYDSNYHIVQSRDYVMIQVEAMRNVRIIPLDGRPHVSPDIRMLLGDSRGHWEGNTLVVDTTNFNDETDFRNAGRNLHVVERFTRVAPNVLLYEFTIDDPTTFTGPFTGIIPMTTIKGPIFEYACNEGNYGLAGILRAARLEEKKRAEQNGHEGQSQAVPEKGHGEGPGQ